MAIDYTVKYASKIADRFKRGSYTDSACGHDYNFMGARGVKIYTMTPADLVDYQRGGTRYGDVTDLQMTTQEMLCTQEKAFTKHLEALDNSDISVDMAAGKFLRMELDEVVNPTMDKYRIKKWCEGAATLKQMSTAPSKATIVGDIMDLKGEMLNNFVPDTGLTLFIQTKYYVMLKQAQAIIDLEQPGTQAIIKGKVGTFDGMDVKPLPDSYFPAGVYFMIKHNRCSADPVKLAQYDVIRKAVGFSGPVVQGLAYYDAFVIGAKNHGIGVAGANTAVLNAPTLAIGSHKVTASGLSGATYMVTVDGSDPRCSTTAENLGSGKTLSPGQTARVIGVKDGCVSKEATQAYE